MSLPKLEGRITVPAGGWSVTVTETPSASATVIVAAAGDYYPTSSTALLSAIATALTADATLAGTYTLTLDDDAATSTGKVTISATGITSFDLDWDDTALRDALGFDDDLSGDDSYTSAASSPYIFLPNNPRMPSQAADGTAGLPVSDATVTVAPSGVAKAVKYATRYEDTFGIQMLLGNKALATWEVVANESWETFWGTVFPAPSRYHRARATDGTYVTWRATMPGTTGLTPAISTFTGGATSLWNLGPFPVIKHV